MLTLFFPLFFFLPILIPLLLLLLLPLLIDDTIAENFSSGSQSTTSEVIRINSMAVSCLLYGPTSNWQPTEKAKYVP